MSTNNVQIVSDAPRARAVRLLTQWITDGTLADGQPLPTEQTLAARLEVSRGTLRSALDNLVEAGLIRSAGGRTRVVVAPTGGGLLGAGLIGNPLRHPVRAAYAHPEAEVAAGPVQIGIIGAWTGLPQQYVFNNVSTRAIENAAAAQPNTTISYFNRFQGIDDPTLSNVDGYQTLVAQGVDRIIILVNDLYSDPEKLNDIVSQDVRVVCLSTSGSLRVPFSQVTLDMEHSGYLAAQHLINRGWEHLVFFQPVEAYWVEKRVCGAREGVSALGLSPQNNFKLWPATGRVPFSQLETDIEEVGLIHGRKFFKNFPGPCGIIAPNDFTAFGVLQAAREAGYTAGEDFGIIGFDDWARSREFNLTSVRPPLEAMGEEAVRLVTLSGPAERMWVTSSFRSSVVPRKSSTYPAAQPQILSPTRLERDLVA